jgi:hypothetical protein
VQGLGLARFGNKGLESTVQGLKVWVQGAGCRVQDAGLTTRGVAQHVCVHV